MEYRQRHDPDPDEVVEDIFTDILDRVTGFCPRSVSWTEPVEPRETGGSSQEGGDDGSENG